MCNCGVHTVEAKSGEGYKLRKIVLKERLKSKFHRNREKESFVWTSVTRSSFRAATACIGIHQRVGPIPRGLAYSEYWNFARRNNFKTNRRNFYRSGWYVNNHALN